MAQVDPDNSMIMPQFADPTAPTESPTEIVDETMGTAPATAAPPSSPADVEQALSGVGEAAPFTEAMQQPYQPSPLSDVMADKPLSTYASGLAKQTDARLEAKKRGKLKVASIDEQLKAIQTKKAEMSQWELVGAMEEHQKEQQGRVKEMMGALKTQNLKYRQAIDDFKNINPNPWATRDTGFLIGSALAAALGGLSAGLAGSGNNPALQMLNNTLSQDLEIQRMRYNAAETNVRNEANMYAQMREIYSDEDAAMSAAWAGSKELIAERGKAIMMTLSPQERTLEAQKLIAQLDADAQEDKVKADQKAFDNHFKVYQVESRERAASQMMELKEKIAMGKGAVSPNVFAAAGLRGKQLDDSVQFMADYTGSFKEAVDFVNKYWAASPKQQASVAAYNMLKSKLAVLSQNLKTINRQGMRFSNKLQEIDEKISQGAEGAELEKVLLNFATDGAMRDNFAMASKAMEDDFRKKIELTSGHVPEYWLGLQNAQHDRDLELLRGLHGAPGGMETPAE